MIVALLQVTANFIDMQYKLGLAPREDSKEVLTNNLCRYILDFNSGSQLFVSESVQVIFRQFLNSLVRMFQGKSYYLRQRRNEE